VARKLDFTQAPQELHLTLPEVTLQINRLEESGGLPLFEQLGRQ